jgi:transcription elongation factor GreA
MNEGQNYLTKEKFKELKNELDFLKTTRRKEVAEHLEYSKSLGDLSENAEYQEARGEQANVEDRIIKLEMLLKSASLLPERHSDTVGIGSTVMVKKDGQKETHKYHIVGSEETDSAQGKISNLSPLGMALSGKKSGETFTFKTPKGEVEYTIVSIQ